MGAAIIGFFVALPKLLDLAKELGELIEKRQLIRKMEAMKNDLEELDDCILKATEATSLSERVIAARRLSDLVGRFK